jgi:hypothetical protein
MIRNLSLCGQPVLGIYTRTDSLTFSRDLLRFRGVEDNEGIFRPLVAKDGLRWFGTHNEGAVTGMLDNFCDL